MQLCAGADFLHVKLLQCQVQEKQACCPGPGSCLCQGILVNELDVPVIITIIESSALILILIRLGPARMFDAASLKVARRPGAFMISKSWACPLGHPKTSPNRCLISTGPWSLYSHVKMPSCGACSSASYARNHLGLQRRWRNHAQQGIAEAAASEKTTGGRHINMAWSLVGAGHLPVASGLAFFGSIEKLKSSSGDVCDEVASRPGNTTVFARSAQSKSRDAICLRDRDLSDSVSLSSIKVPLQVSLPPGWPDVTGGLAGLLGMPSCRKSSTLTTGRPAGASGLVVLDPGCRKRKACQGNRSKIREGLGPVCPLLLLHPCT